MERREVVCRAIEFKTPPRLPFFIGRQRMEASAEYTLKFPHDVHDCWEMDRQKAGWFFDNAAEDDWGCMWKTTNRYDMGQVIYSPLEDWSHLKTYMPPNPRDDFYFERVEESIKDSEDRYVVITSHFNLLERLEMLHGFNRTYEDFYSEPEKVHRVLDMILEYKINLINEAGKRFKDRVHGIFLTDDWGTQQSTLASPDVFKEFFFSRYKRLFEEVHNNGWHVILHSCGKVNKFVPYFIEAGADVLNMLQSQLYGLEEFGNTFAGKVCFLGSVDIQTTLPQGNPDAIRAEAKDLIKYWSTLKGGFIVFSFGASESLGTTDAALEIMLNAFYESK